MLVNYFMPWNASPTLGMSDMQPEESKYTLDEIIKRVQNLLARAEHESTAEAEAALCRSHAERLMRVWRLKEEDALATDPLSVTPIHRRIFIAGYDSEFYVDLFALMTRIAAHSDVMMHTSYSGETVDGMYGIVVTVVGFEVDVHQAEWLFSSARLHFRSHLEPEIDATLSEQENVYRLRRAGFLRKDVAMRMWGQNTPSLRTKAQRLYIRECNARGEEPQLEGLGTDAKTFRQAYARGFVDRVSARLRAARDAADSSGGVVMLANRAQRVKAAYDELFPPRPVVDAPTPTGKPRPYRGPTKAQLRRMEREHFSPAARAGKDEGRVAADQVEIKRVDPTPRIEG